MNIKQAFKEAYKGSFKLGILVAGVSYVVAWLVNFFNISPISVTASVIDVRSQVASSGIAPAFGQRVIDFFEGILAMDFMSIATVLIGSYLLVFIGKLLLNLGLPELKILGRGNVMKMYSILFYGSIVAFLSMVFFGSLPLDSALIAMIVYYFGISVLIAILMQSDAVSRWVSR